jgi:hypothetical protein
MASAQKPPKEPEADFPRDPTTNRPIATALKGVKTKGMSGKLNEEQREFARRVLTLGKEGGQAEYEANLRKRMLAGILAPALEILVLHYMYGKPPDTLVVKDKTPKGSHLGELSAEELRLRALAVAQAIVEARSQAEREEPDASESDESDDAIH